MFMTRLKKGSRVLVLSLVTAFLLSACGGSGSENGDISTNKGDNSKSEGDISTNKGDNSKNKGDNSKNKGDNSNSEISDSNKSVSSDKEKEVIEGFNDMMGNYSKLVNSVSYQVSRSINNLPDDFSTNPENISNDQVKQFFSDMDDLSYILDANLLTGYYLIKTIKLSPTLKKGLSSARYLYRKPKQRVIGMTVLIGGIALTVTTTIIKEAIDIHKEKIDTTIKTINQLDKKDLESLNEELGYPKNTTRGKLSKEFANMGIREQGVIANKVYNHAFINGYDQTTETYKKIVSKGAVKLGKAGVSAVVGASTTVLGGQGVDKAASAAAQKVGLNPETAKNVGAIVDFGVSYAGVQPTDIIMASVSKEKKKVKIKKSTIKSEEEAEKILEDKNATSKEKEEARKKFQEIIAKESGIVTKENSSEMEVQIPQKISVGAEKDFQNGNEVKIGATGIGSTIMIISKEFIPVVKEKIDIIEDFIINMIPPKTIESFFGEIASVSVKKIKEDLDSIEYSITVNAKNLKEDTSAKISIANGAVSNSTKTLKKGGSISWKVSVLRDDATYTVEINGIQWTGTLPGKGIDTSPIGNSPIKDYVGIEHMSWKATLEHTSVIVHKYSDGGWKSTATSGGYGCERLSLYVMDLIIRTKYPNKDWTFDMSISVADDNEYSKEYTRGKYDAKIDKMKGYYLPTGLFGDLSYLGFPPKVNYEGTLTSGEYKAFYNPDADPFSTRIECLGTYTAVIKDWWE